MMPSSETSVLLIIVIVIVTWGYFIFKRWLYAPPRIKLPMFTDNKADVQGELADLLRDAGYDVIYGKVRIPLTFTVDDDTDNIFRSRYYIDALVKQHNDWYVVKTARARQTMDWTGSGLRDKLLPYVLLCQSTGILFVDMEQRSIRKIVYELD